MCGIEIIGAHGGCFGFAKDRRFRPGLHAGLRSTGAKTIGKELDVGNLRTFWLVGISYLH